jgi:DNA polymerase III alpha subunit
VRIDEYGRSIASAEELFSLILQKEFSEQLLAEDDEDTALYNEQCRKHDRENMILTTPEFLCDPMEYHRIRSSDWLIPTEYQAIDLREYLYGLCETEAQVERVMQEMDLYEQRELTDVLRLLIYLVDNFRSNKIVWGVGRGSSVASFVLFLIGIHKIDPLRFGLEISEFLR